MLRLDSEALSLSEAATCSSPHQRSTTLHFRTAKSQTGISIHNQSALLVLNIFSIRFSLVLRFGVNMILWRSHLKRGNYDGVEEQRSKYNMIFFSVTLVVM